MMDMKQMRNIIKNGALYRLSSVNTVEDSSQGQNQISSFEKISSEQDNKMNRPRSQQLIQHNKTQNIIAIICGALFGLITTFGAIYLVYIYVFEGILKEYIPFLRSSQIFLTENTAREYFERFPIYAGEIHYSKIPVQYWEHRIKMVKSMGLNSITTSIFWNYHQISKGIFDFSTENKNLTKFLSIAKNQNLRVILRTGPYVNSEQDFGGLPSRLLSIKHMELRSSNNLYIQQTKIYINELMKILRPFIQNSQNPQGPIILLEIQHESGQLNDQMKYISKLKQLWNQLQPECPLFYSDNENYFSKNMISGQNIIIGINIQQYKHQKFYNLDKQKTFFFTVNSGFQISLNKNTLYDSSYYINKFTAQFSDILLDKRSFSMNIHINYNDAKQNKIHFPIMNENGFPTQAYHIFRSIFANYMNTTLPSIPQRIQSMQINFDKIQSLSSILDNLGEPLTFSNASIEPLAFESQQLKMFHQGIFVYQTTLKGPKKYNFDIKVHDYGIIYLDDSLFSNIKRKQSNQNIKIDCKKQQCKLQIVIEAMEHRSKGPLMIQDKKGLICFKQNTTENTQHKFIWKYYKFDLRDQPQWINKTKCTRLPCVYQAQTGIQQPRDTYLSLKNSLKGYVWVNGRSLGGYEKISSQDKIYCPGVWLRKGINKITILDIYHNALKQIIEIKGQKSK